MVFHVLFDNMDSWHSQLVPYVCIARVCGCVRDFLMFIAAIDW